MNGAAPSHATPLALKLAERIARAGPISVADFVAACLQDADFGYYRRKAAIGAEGDFVTAPEISQVFGELIGLWCAVVWQQMGGPPKVRLVELGPGRGTLMRDALRAARLVPAFIAALSVELVESNATLEEAQRQTLDGEQVPVTWAPAIVPGDGPVILIANEFLDVLPAEQLVFRQGAWCVRCVGLDASNRLVFVDGPVLTDARLPQSVSAPADGDIFETRQRAFADLARQLASAGQPVAGLFIDYGHQVSGLGDTLQAVAAHRYADPLENPGEADLTVQVDFAAFDAVMRACGFHCDGPVPQGEFLGRLGAVERASRLMAANPGQAAAIEVGLARLMGPTGMGSRFQVIGIRSVDLAPLPALAAVDSQHSAS
ncbi:MAG: SAM-dependent methyltransferase [Hyphomicrobium sp.]|jgi:SAM-dependent MidA family methyltransferase